MRIRRWRYFWKWFLAVAVIVYAACCFFYYCQPKIYESESLIEALELYPGENVALPAPPEDSRITVEAIAGTRLTKMTSRDEDPNKAATDLVDFGDRWFEERRVQAREKLDAEQASLEPGSATWRKLEIERRMPVGRAGIIHERPEVGMRPSSPDPDRFVAVSRTAIVVLGLAIAGLMAWRRGDREDDGAVLSWARIGRRFRKIAIWTSAAYLLIAAAFFVAEPPTHVAVADVQLPRSTNEEFETQLGILSSREPLRGAIRELGLLSVLVVSTEREAIEILKEAVDISTDRDRSTAEIRSQLYDPELAEKISTATAASYLRRYEERVNHWPSWRKSQLKASLRTLMETDPVAIEIQQELALPAAAPPDIPAKLLGKTRVEKLPKDWVAFFTSVAWIQVLRACLLAAIITTISLIWFSAEARTTAARRLDGTGVLGEANTSATATQVTDPY